MQIGQPKNDKTAGGAGDGPCEHDRIRHETRVLVHCANPSCLRVMIQVQGEWRVTRKVHKPKYVEKADKSRGLDVR